MLLFLTIVYPSFLYEGPPPPPPPPPPPQGCFLNPLSQNSRYEGRYHTDPLSSSGSFSRSLILRSSRPHVDFPSLPENKSPHEVRMNDFVPFSSTQFSPPGFSTPGVLSLLTRLTALFPFCGGRVLSARRTLSETLASPPRFQSFSPEFRPCDRALPPPRNNCSAQRFPLTLEFFLIPVVFCPILRVCPTVPFSSDLIESGFSSSPETLSSPLFSFNAGYSPSLFTAFKYFPPLAPLSV